MSRCWSSGRTARMTPTGCTPSPSIYGERFRRSLSRGRLRGADLQHRQERRHYRLLHRRRERDPAGEGHFARQACGQETIELSPVPSPAGTAPGEPSFAHQTPARAVAGPARRALGAALARRPRRAFAMAARTSKGDLLRSPPSALRRRCTDRGSSPAPGAALAACGLRRAHVPFAPLPRARVTPPRTPLGRALGPRPAPRSAAPGGPR